MLAERFRLLRLLRFGGGVALAMIMANLVVSLGPAMTALAVGFAVDRAEAAVQASDVAVAVPGVLAIGIVLLVTQAFENSTEFLAAEARWGIDGWVRRKVRAAAAAQPTLVELGDPLFQDDITRASDLGHRGGRVRSPGAAAVGQALFTLRLVGGIMAAVVLAQFSVPLAGLVVLLALLNRAILRRQWMHLAGVDDAQSRLRRRTDYWSTLGRDPRVAGEVRLFGLGPWITTRHRRVLAAERGPVLRDRMSVMRQQSLIILLTVGTAFVGILPPVLAATSGNISAAQLVTSITAVWGILNLLAGMGHEAFDIEYGRSTVRALDRLIRDTSPARPTRPPAPSPAAIVELADVTFAYPTQTGNVLTGLDLTIRKGEVLGIVGPNGAGKTTLVKMIAGLLEPTSGTIRIGEDGTTRATAVFQDLLHYPLTLRDNVALAAPEVEATDAAVLDALRQADAGYLAERLPHGLDTILHRDLDQGVEISGGQWQRVAIARAVFAAHAGREIVILDEPTANLDVRAETAFYETVVRTLPGATTLLISHRLSTVRRADRIVLLSGGRITEQGGHTELIAQRGEYARLFELQASRFGTESRS